MTTADGFSDRRSPHRAAENQDLHLTSEQTISPILRKASKHKHGYTSRLQDGSFGTLQQARHVAYIGLTVSPQDVES